MAIGRSTTASHSLRGLSWAFVVLFGGLVTANAAVLEWMSGVTWQAAQQVEQASQDFDSARDVERALREYHRIGNLWVATHDPELQVRLLELESELRQLLDQLALAGGDDQVSSLLILLKDQVATYLDAREAVAHRGLPLEEVVRSIRSPFELALATTTALEASYQSSLQRGQARAQRAQRSQSLIAVAAAIALALSFAAVAFGVHRLIVRPILGLQEAVRRFRAGDAGAKAPGGSLAEIRELAARFNEMTDTISRQRRDQLTFLAGVAHDLKNPLAGLKLTVQVLERDPTAATPERFRLLDRQLDRITRMVGDLLDTTRIEAGALDLRMQRFDLRDAARTVMDHYTASTTTHRLSLNAPEQPVMVMGDPHRVEQVIGNLLGNAIKYSPNGGPVDVTVAMAGSDAVLSVSDHGVGIPPEDVADVFLPFRRGAGTAALAPGEGLGLSIVRRIVAAHGGRIDVESAPARGSTFRVRLPAEVAPGIASAQRLLQ